ncbi:MAG: di-heme oxidoredictase family protein [Nannocystaceae bacterium]
MRTLRAARLLAPLTLIPLVAACGDTGDDPTTEPEVADIFVERLGDAAPYATAEQLETFDRGFDMMLHRFTPEEGLGPTTNVTFCAACHEAPMIGGGAPRYRDFYLHGEATPDGEFALAPKGGVVMSYGRGSAPLRPSLMEGSNVQAKRSGMPMWGSGAISEIFESSILDNADPDDADGDGISGRAGYVKGYLGRFGRKLQKATVEGFVRDPINNHAGITSNPLTPEQNARLPIDHSQEVPWLNADIEPAHTDDDDVPDPELSPEDVFDLVTFSMLLAPPAPDPNPSEAAIRGNQLFDDFGCASCHVRGLEGARGMVPLYSDLLLHDMGDELADGIVMAGASGSEFRTQPLWGIVASRPYLHDGRADTLEDAILWHGGEALASREAFEDASDDERLAVIAFLESLGGAEQATPGLLPVGAPIPEPGVPGAPLAAAVADDAGRELWLQGRALFDLDFGENDGLGPVFNGDSCRGCHFDPLDAEGKPTVGGAGPTDVNVMRHGNLDADGNFTAPAYGTILHKLTVSGVPRREHTDEHNMFEQRQTPTTLGLGLLSAIDDDDIRALADPDDLDGDGIRGFPHELPNGRVGRLSWKGGVTDVREFVRDAMSAEMGITVPVDELSLFGSTSDQDGIADPEITNEQIDAMAYFIANLAPPMPTADVPGGIEAFTMAGCDGCHVPEIPGSGEGFPTPAYTDLLLHSVAPAGALGIDDGEAMGTLFRTPPLWGMATTGPYMHDGEALTIEQAIAAHDGEAQASRAAYEAMSEDDRATLIRFVETR